MMTKMCMLEENKICDNCLECDYCDLNPGKICDNCAKCIADEAEYKVIDIDEIVITAEIKRKFKSKFELDDGHILDSKKIRG